MERDAATGVVEGHAARRANGRRIGRPRVAVLVIMLVVGAGPYEAQGRTPRGPARRGADGALGAAIDEYKVALRELIATLERNERDAAGELDRRRKLFVARLMTKRDVDASAAALDAVRARIDTANLELEEADFLAAEATVPDAPRSSARLAESSIVRSDGGRWSIGQLVEVQNFYSARFGRSLPVSAFGQTALHDRLGFDHRNAVDVALSPDGVEGRAMLDYLRRAGIPFLAFRNAIPGRATGPHIHIGFPSHRLAR